MQKWEYMIRYIADLRQIPLSLNELGREGWELIISL